MSILCWLSTVFNSIIFIWFIFFLVCDTIGRNTIWTHWMIQSKSRLWYTIPDFIKLFLVLSNIMSMGNLAMGIVVDVEQWFISCHSLVSSLNNLLPPTRDNRQYFWLMLQIASILTAGCIFLFGYFCQHCKCFLVTFCCCLQWRQSILSYFHHCCCWLFLVTFHCWLWWRFFSSATSAPAAVNVFLLPFTAAFDESKVSSARAAAIANFSCYLSLLALMKAK